MARLVHDSGGEAVLKCGQILGNDSPVEFGEDGIAYISDEEAAEQIDALYRHVDAELGITPPGESGGEGIDAESFVDRTPMSAVIGDLETGEYDDHLDAIKKAADRQGVLDAIKERRE